MPMWRCPHCATPQVEASRCWVCKRSSTSCATCRHFRRSVAAQIGYCGLDRRRIPLRGDEIRGCWTPDVRAGFEPLVVPALPSPSRTAVRALDFVPVESAPVAGPAETASPVSGGQAQSPPALARTSAVAIASPVLGWNERTTLFDDPER